MVIGVHDYREICAQVGVEIPGGEFLYPQGFHHWGYGTRLGSVGWMCFVDFLRN